MFSEQHFYLTAIGDCYGQAERWQFGLRMTLVAVTPDTPQTVTLDLADDVQNWFTSGGAADGFGAPSTHRLTELKGALIGTDGKYVPGTTSYSHFYLPPVVTGNSAPSGQVPQSTIAATLTTGVPRGLASKGRIYLPPSIRYVPDPATGLISTTAADQLANSVKNLIAGINGSAYVDAVQVMSQGRGVKVENVAKKRYDWTYPNEGVSSPVTGVRVGRVVDTQRRRRRQLVENYRTVVV